MSDNISGPVVAVLTPLQQSGVIDFAAMTDYLDLLASAGVETILVNGTTGEFASTTVREKIQIVDHCRRHWGKSLVAHVGACAIDDAMEMTRHAHECADALAVINPYFFAGAPEAGVTRYFQQVLRVSERPTLLYNFPHHTQTPISARTVARIAAEFPHVIGIKDSGKDRALSREYQRIASGFRVYLGDDRAGADIRDLGFAGIVTGAGGPVAELPVAIAAAVSAGEPGEARARQREFDRYTDARKRMTCGDIAFAKAAAAARLPGFPFHVRTPLLETSFAQREEIHTVMKAIVPRPSPH